MNEDAGAPLTVAKAPPRPLLIWDGDCGFCRLWVTRWRNEVAHAVDTAPYQEVEARFPEIPREHFQRAVQLVETNGEVASGAEAVFRAFAAGGHSFALHLYKRSSSLATVTDAAYRFVATHRVLASKVTGAIWGRDPSPSTFRVARALFVRGLGVVALAAFVSAWMQVDGLIGTSGIAPVDVFLRSVGQMADDQAIHLDRYRLVPTLLWLSPTDSGLHTLLAAGVLASIALVLDWFATVAVVVAWASYLSIVTVGSVFFGYQWDTLLLEALPTEPVGGKDERWKIELSVREKE